MTVPTLPTISPLTSGLAAGRTGAGAATPSFLDTVQNALGEVSNAQHQAAGAEQAVAAGAPGASTSTALVLSDRAELEWSAVVAVRNEMVSAYQTVMNMQI